jgi:hypothetical protein
MQPAADAITLHEMPADLAEQRVSAPDLVLVHDSKEDAGMPPVPAAPSGKTEISNLEARNLTDWGHDHEMTFSPADLRNGKFDAALREKIRALVPAEFVEPQLQRVLKMMRH